MKKIKPRILSNQMKEIFAEIVNLINESWATDPGLIDISPWKMSGESLAIFDTRFYQTTIHIIFNGLVNTMTIKYIKKSSSMPFDFQLVFELNNEEEINSQFDVHFVQTLKKASMERFNLYKEPATLEIIENNSLISVLAKDNNINQIKVIKYKLSVEEDHPDPSRMVYIPKNLLRKIQNCYTPGKFLEAVVPNENNNSENHSLLDVGLLNTSQSDLRDGDSILLFSLNCPGEVYPQTVQGYSPVNPLPFTCRTESFDYDFSNFFIVVKATVTS